jgi:uncharacterized protein YbaP (TraB family)
MRRAIIAILLAGLAGPVLADDAQPVNATPAMWVVHGPKATMYLLGSIHILPKTMNWHTPAITAALKSADSFVFEMPMDKDEQTRAATVLGQNMLLPITTSLPSLFDNDMRRDFKEVILQDRIDPRLIVYMRPWLAANALEGEASGTAGLHPSEGVDYTVYAEAKARGVEDFRAFESPDLHTQLFMDDGTPGGEMEKLRQTLKRMLKEKPDFQALLTAWSKGDVKGLIAMGPDNAEMSPETKRLILDDRNNAWIPQIQAMLRERHTYFVTVGAAHLVGPGGIPNRLRAAGYTVDGP